MGQSSPNAWRASLYCLLIRDDDLQQNLQTAHDHTKKLAVPARGEDRALSHAIQAKRWAFKLLITECGAT